MVHGWDGPFCTVHSRVHAWNQLFTRFYFLKSWTTVDGNNLTNSIMDHVTLLFCIQVYDICGPLLQLQDSRLPGCQHFSRFLALDVQSATAVGGLRLALAKTPKQKTLLCIFSYITSTFIYDNILFFKKKI